MDNGWNLLASSFYNDNQVIAWNAVTRSSTPVGRLKTIGAELELAYKGKKFDFGANHSYVKQLSWQLAEGLTTSGISYGDYYLNTSYVPATGVPAVPVLLRSTGNDLNNYSDHMTKVFGNLKLVNDKFTLHGDMKVLWGMTGAKDGLEMQRRAGSDSVGTWDRVLKDKDAYGILINGNVSLTYHMNKSADIAVYVQNIPIKGENKRYSYSSGTKTSVPERTMWIEEPMMVGARFTARF
jgi:hypothetical protein